MLLIRKAQIDILAAASLSRFERELAADLKAAHPGRFASVEPMEFVRNGVARANHYGVKSSGAVAALLQLMAQFGGHLENAPHRAWAEQILSHPSLPESLKVSIVRERLDELSQGRTVLSVD